MRGRTSRPWWRRHGLDWLEAAAAYGIAYGFGLLPLPVASAVSGWIARTLGPRLGISRRAHENLQRALPDLSLTQRRAVVRAMWDNFGRTVIELTQLGRYQRLLGTDTFHYEGVEHVEACRRAGKPILFLSAHFGNWEVLGLLARRYGYELIQVYRPTNNRLLDGLVRRLRTPACRHLVPKGQGGTRQLLKAARAGDPIGMLVDQRLSEGVVAPFLGLPAPTTPVAAQIAIRYGYALVPVKSLRVGGCRIRAVIEPAIEIPAEGDEAARVAAVTAEMNARIGRWVREHPGQWLWLHRRWGKF
jgi:KDO2-lipid IV(A) lauroyltransferase